MTLCKYKKEPFLFETNAKIVNHKSDSKGSYFILNQSIFYPQGGGQPADQGKIITSNAIYEIYDVRKIDNEIRHYTSNTNININLNEIVKIKIDENRRILNSKYHTAGHLISIVTENIFTNIKTIKGHHFPGEAYVEFNSIIDNSIDAICIIEQKIKDCIETNAIIETRELNYEEIDKVIKDLPYKLPENTTLSVWKIKGYPYVPCGGTHVKTLKDVSTVKISKISNKKGKSRISYQV